MTIGIVILFEKKKFTYVVIIFRTSQKNRRKLEVVGLMPQDTQVEEGVDKEKIRTFGMIILAIHHHYSRQLII